MNGSVRVLIVHNRYRSGQPSGEDRVVDQESAMLAAAGHDVRYFVRHSDDIASMSPLAKAAVPLLVPWNPRARTELARRLRASRPDVVHIHCTFPLLSPSVLAACADVGVPAVATLHNFGQVCAPGSLYRDGRICTDCVGGSPLPAVRHGCYRGSVAATVPVAVGMAVNRRRWHDGVARFLCISRAQREILVAAGLPDDRTVVHGNLVPDPGVRRSGPGRHVFYLGRLTEEKGLRVLMRAWELLAERSGGAGMPLVIAGAGPLEDEVGRWADHRSDVDFRGLQSRDECAALMAGAAAVVVPSVWLETFGLVVAEAMAAGVPVVASDHGAFPELVVDGVTGALHRPGDAGSLADALTRVVADPARREEMGRAARRRYEAELDPAAGLERLVDIYRSVTARASRLPS